MLGCFTTILIGENTTITDNDPESMTRKVREALHIRNLMNRDDGLDIPYMWDSLLTITRAFLCHCHVSIYK
jgi:hypothetical protein